MTDPFQDPITRSGMRAHPRGVKGAWLVYLRGVVEERELHLTAEGLREDGAQRRPEPLGRVVYSHHHRLRAGGKVTISNPAGVYSLIMRCYMLHTCI